MKPVTLDWVALACEGELLDADPAQVVSRVRTDSRRVQAGDLFVALKGERFDAHDFLGDVVASGAAALVVSREYPGVARVVVGDTLAALQRMASAHRGLLSVPVIAVGGSNGKTSTKELLAAALGSRLRVAKTEGNLNNHIGVPMTLLTIDERHEAAVVEVGTNHPGEIAQLSGWVRPDVAVVTNIGAEHLEFLVDEAGVAREEGDLLAGLRAGATAVLNADDPWTPALRERTQARVWTAGFAEDADMRVREWEATEDGQRFVLECGGESRACAIPLTGRHMAVNAALAAAAALAAGVALEDAVRGMGGVVLPGARMRVARGRGVTLIDDSYNANPSSMLAALDELALAGGRRVAVLGTMGELGSGAAEWHRRVGAAARERGIDLVVAVGPHAPDYASGAGASAQCCADTAEAGAWLRAGLRAGDTVLLKASRSAAFERIAEALGFNGPGGGH